MHLHFHNASDHNGGYNVNEDLWAAALARGSRPGPGCISTHGETDEDLLRLAGRIEVLFLSMPVLRKLIGIGIVSKLPRLRAIMLPNAGLDSLGPFDWLPPGVALLNNRGVHARKAGEFGLMALLMLANNMPHNVTAQRVGLWQRRAGATLSSRRITIVGLGSLGGSTALHARNLGAHVTGVRTSAESHDGCAEVVDYGRLDEVISRTDILFLACPLTETTRGMIDRRRLLLLPQGAGVVNIGRGPVIDEGALFDLLDEERLGGAVLDVFQKEPLDEEHRAWTIRNLIVTPHMSSDNPATYMSDTLDILKVNLEALERGETPPNRFDTARGY